MPITGREIQLTPISISRKSLMILEISEYADRARNMLSDNGGDDGNNGDNGDNGGDSGDGGSSE